MCAPARDQYLVKSVVHASRALAAFRNSGEVLALREITSRSGLSRAMVFRLMYTLQRCGVIKKVGENLYRSNVRPFRHKPYRLGYASQGADDQFAKEIAVGLERAAAVAGLKMIVVGNRPTSRISQRSVDVLVKEKVDLAIELQTDEQAAPIIAEKYREANIPFIAVGVPHPGGTYFGADNLEAGLVGGQCLGRWARRHWPAGTDEIVLIQSANVGSALGSRCTGMLAGMTDVFPQLAECRVKYLHTDGTLGESLQAMRRHLRSRHSRRMLIGAINDASAVGALRACQEAGRAEFCAVVGQNASPEARAELREPSTRLIGSVAYFPETYGEQIISVALDILHRRPVPPAVFVKHRLVTPRNINHIYPNDGLLAIARG